jgi:hypothetical protein
MVQSVFVVLLVLLVLVLVATLFSLYFLHNSKEEDSRDAYSEYSLPDYSDTAGFYLVSLPVTDILIPERYWLVNDKVAEVEYKVAPNWRVTLRAAETGNLVIPKPYSDATYDNTSEYAIETIPVTHKASPGQKVLITWSKNGFDYALYSNEPEMNLMGGITYDFVTKSDAKKA